MNTGTLARTEGAADALATISAAQSIDSPLGEANEFSTNNPENPLRRSVVVSVRASLEDLCLRKAKATWCPSDEATAAIFKQHKFIDLQGTSEKVLATPPTVTSRVTNSFMYSCSKAT